MMRIQRKRVKGWRMPENTVSVCRPGKYGNMFVVGCNPSQFSTALPGYCDSVHMAVACYDHYANMRMLVTPDWLKPLRGKNLACFCKLCEKHKDGKPLNIKCADCAPCHADPLGALANQ